MSQRRETVKASQETTAEDASRSSGVRRELSLFNTVKRSACYVSSGQKAAALPSVTTAPVGLSRTTGARRHLQDATRTRRAGRTRSPGTKRTSGSAAAPGAAAARRRAPPPGTGAPARSSPPTADRTTPGETSLCLAAAVHLLCFICCGLRCFAERGTAPTALTPTVEPAAAHAATHPSEREGETPPASWRLGGSPGNGCPDHLVHESISMWTFGSHMKSDRKSLLLSYFCVTTMGFSGSSALHLLKEILFTIY